MNDEVFDVLIVGGGAAGVVAAIRAKEASPGGRVGILERNPRLLRKVAASGNGRCNLSNRDCRADLYYCDCRGFVETVLATLPEEGVADFFAELGVALREDEQGRRYPHAEQAEAVAEKLLERVTELGVELLTGEMATRAELWSGAPSARAERVPGGGAVAVERQGEGGNAAPGFVLTLADGRTRRCRRLVLAGGGAAGLPQAIACPLYAIAAGFGHRVNPLAPVLSKLLSTEPYLKQLHGVRSKARVSLRVNGEVMATETGEVQFTEQGVSGIAVFDLSRKLKPGDQHIEVALDFYPDWTNGELAAWIAARRRAHPHRPIESLLAGLIHRKLAAVLAKRYPLVEPAELAKVLKGWRIPIAGSAGMETAQATRGGISCREINPHTLESRLVKGLYFAGELLDVDGPSGGRNLQWAWASGSLAGQSAGKPGSCAP